MGIGATPGPVNGKLQVSDGINLRTGPLYMNGAAGTTGQVLTSAGSGSVPTWSNPSVSSISVSNTCGGTTYAGSNGISVSGTSGYSGINACGVFITQGYTGYTGSVVTSVSIYTVGDRYRLSVETRNVINGIIV